MRDRLTHRQTYRRPSSQYISLGYARCEMLLSTGDSNCAGAEKQHLLLMLLMLLTTTTMVVVMVIKRTDTDAVFFVTASLVTVVRDNWA